MQKTISILILFFSLSSTILSQNIQKGYEYLNQNEIEKAEKIFNKFIDQNKEIVPAKYGLTLIILKKDKTSTSNTRAYQNILDIKKRYTKLPLDIQKNYGQNFGISINSIDTLTQWILNDEYTKTINSQKISVFNYFIDVYKNTAQADKVLRYRDSIAFDETNNSGNLFDYLKFLNDYPQSYFHAEALKNRDSIWKSEYNIAFKSLELKDIKAFMNLYSDYPFFDDSTDIYTTWAIQVAKLQLHLGFLTANNSYYGPFIKSAAPFEMAYQTLLCIIQPDLDNNNIKGAIDSVLKYKPYFKNSKKINTILEILKKPIPKLEPKSLSDNINTEAFEYMPVITADGNTLYFCSEDREGSMGHEDIFVTYFKNGEWTKPVVVAELSTVHANEAPLSVSADGNSLIIFSNGDIFIASKTKYGWNEKQAIKEINTNKFWEADAYLTADANAIIFSSDREGNIGSYHEFNKPFHGDYVGNLDLYVITKNSDGFWSQPKNLGSTINTPYTERTPFLHPDMKTLYFSSDGHASVGKMDVFKSTRLNDTSWTDWSEPVNLDLPINSSQKEYGYKISTDGTKAFYTKFFNGQSDIYVVSLPENDRPEQVATISGIITDNKGNPLDAKIIWEDLSTSKQLGELSSNPVTGKYFITLPLQKNYGVFVSKEAYYPVSENIDLLTQTTNISIEKNFKLVNIDNIIDGSATIELKNVFFDYDKFTLKKESYTELNRLADFIIKFSNLKIEISGHTDAKGSEEYNLQLSQQRAQAVKDYLVSKGCKPNQLIAKGYGASVPIADNNSENGRKLNRRVEFKVVY